MTIGGRHLTDERLMDLVDGAREREAERHAAECADCAARLAEAREGLALARTAEVPEPAGLYWQSFRKKVADRVGSAASSPRWRGWLVPVFAATVALAAVVSLLPRQAPEAPPSPALTLAPWSPLPAADTDLPVLQALGPDLDPALDCGGLAECLADLSDEESQDLVRMLRPAVKDDGSL